jgi:phosphate starvation-inducible protein PhoH and related proteins
MARANRSNKEVRVASRVQRKKRREMDVEDGRKFSPKFDNERESKIVHINPKTQAQEDFLQVMRDNDVAIGLGAAGSGKSYLAGSFIANEYLRNPGMNILLARPYVPMGGRTVGFLSGSSDDKLAPFVAAQTAILKKHLGKKYESDFGLTINIQLLEAIRGLDLKNTCLWVDECQLLTREEFKCILTRVSTGGKVILTGDPVQSDLRGEESGLDWVCEMIEKYNINGCDFVEFTDDDCVRSGIVREWLNVFKKERV